MQNVFRSLIQVFATAEGCAEKGFVLPTLILLYSAMDTLGWMAAPDPKAKVQTRFVSWASKYALPASPRLRCSALELYAARCGVLHTFTADSTLSEKGTRRIVYAWGKAEIDVLQATTERVGNDKWVAVHLADLSEGVRLGAIKMFDDAEAEPELAARLRDRGARFFKPLDQAALDPFKDPDLRPNDR